MKLDKYLDELFITGEIWCSLWKIKKQNIISLDQPPCEIFEETSSGIPYN